MRKNARINGARGSRVPERVISDLRQLGFTEYEARTYLTLLAEHPATAYEVGKAASLPRANVYSALDALEKKGAVQPVSENPVRYVPVDPKMMLDVIARTTSRLCTDLGERIAAVAPARKQDYVWILEGEESVHNSIEEMIVGASTHVWIKAHETAVLRHIDALRDASARGVKLLVILFGEPHPEKRIDLGPGSRIYPHEGTGVVVGLGQSLVTITADFGVALTANLGEETHGALTRNRPVVNLAESLIRHEVYLAEIFSHYGTRITERFGPLMRDLRQKYLPKDQVQALEKTIRVLSAERVRKRSRAGARNRGRKSSFGAIRVAKAEG